MKRAMKYFWPSFLIYVLVCAGFAVANYSQGAALEVLFQSWGGSVILGVVFFGVIAIFRSRRASSPRQPKV